MAKRKTKSFTLNDEREENSHGFYVLNSGGRFGRFKNNPVMLADHRNETESVVGGWQNLREEPYLLVADPLFDEKSPKAKKLQEQVEDEFVRGASLGLIPIRFEMINDKLWLVEWEMIEASIVPVPSNRRSLAIYSEAQELLSDDQVQSICLSIKETIPNVKPNFNMKKVNLTLAALVALGFTEADKEGVEETVLEQKILNLSKQKDTLQTQCDALVAEREVENQRIALAAVDTAITDGKITADKKETFLSLFKTNAELAKQTLAAIPGKSSLGANFQTPGATVVATLDDFQKLSLAAQIEFKKSQPEDYKKLFN